MGSQRLHIVLPQELIAEIDLCWQNWSPAATSSQQQPSSEFKDGRGEFFDQESLSGRTILVRIVWSDVTPESHRFEQAFSDDGGKTWEPNFMATLTREKP
jgi:hypothetical protein